MKIYTDGVASLGKAEMLHARWCKVKSLIQTVEDQANTAHKVEGPYDAAAHRALFKRPAAAAAPRALIKRPAGPPAAL